MSQEFDILGFLKQLESQPTTALGVYNLSVKKSTARAKWSSRFDTWAKPLSETEDQKCANAENMVRTAFDGHSEFSGLSLNVFAQGSSKANTNVRTHSDVDISARCSTFYYAPLPTGVSPQMLGFQTSTLSFSAYKLKVKAALIDKFTATYVKPGDKAFKILPNSYRISTDVVPTFEYRNYYYIGEQLKVRTGSCFYTDSGKFIINWPDETHNNGVAKNERTGRRYKKVVRVLKGLRYEMELLGFESAKKISSFQLACLAYNLLDVCYGSDTLYDDVKRAASQIWYHAYIPAESAHWTEIDEIKPMFPSDQPTKRQEVADFFWQLRSYAELMDNQ